MNTPYLIPGISEEQRLNAILILEGMPAELPLLVDSADYQPFPQEPETELSAHDEVKAALSLDDATPVDVFIEAQHPIEYRFKDDCEELQ